MVSDEYAHRVAEKLMSKVRIRCIESSHGYSFVATCPNCDLERLLTSDERVARKMFCCGAWVILLPYDKKSGLDLPQGLKNFLRKTGVPGWDRVKTWEEYNREIQNRARRFAERHNEFPSEHSR